MVAGYCRYCTRTLHHLILHGRRLENPQTVAAIVGSPDKQWMCTGHLAATITTSLPCKRSRAPEFMEKLLTQLIARNLLGGPKVIPQCIANATSEITLLQTDITSHCFDIQGLDHLAQGKLTTQSVYRPTVFLHTSNHRCRHLSTCQRTWCTTTKNICPTLERFVPKDGCSPRPIGWRST